MTTEKKCVDGRKDYCCSAVEQISWRKGGQGMRDELASGWKVSQVEALIDLPRRDIQRACYEGPGGIGIVRPRNTSWGWRVYEVADVAKLFLLAQARRRSQTLEEACREFTPSEGKTDLASALELCEQRARDARDTEAGALMAARALKCALAHEDQSIFAGLIDSAFGESARRTCDDHIALELAAKGLLSNMLENIAELRKAGKQPTSSEAKHTCMAASEICAQACELTLPAACELLSQAVNAPGVALTCELWLGPATHSFANTSLEATLVEMEEGAPDKRAE